MHTNTTSLQDAYDNGTLDWKKAYLLTGERGQTGVDLATEFLTTVFDGTPPREISGKDDNRNLGDLWCPSGASVEVKTQPITPWAQPLPEEPSPTRAMPANLYPTAWGSRRVYPSNFIEFGVAMLNPSDFKDYHADWVERTSDLFQVSQTQVRSARVWSTKERRWYALGDFEQVGVAFSSWKHAALVLYCEPLTKSVVAYTSSELITYIRRAFINPPKFSLVRDPGRCSPGTIGMLGVPYGSRRFQQKPDGTWRSLSPTNAPIGREVRDILGYHPAVAGLTHRLGVPC